ncbi:TVP38/TMEM64 family protein [Myxococcota bacterium]|nr:TVP38/TMEM64 family protein [Myxococcota bacterium]
MGRRGRGALALGLLAAVGTAALLPVDAWFGAFAGWVRDAGPAGAALYALVYVVAALLFLPGSVFTMVAGSVYGPAWGLALVSPVSVIAATLSFLLGRTVARHAVEARLRGNPRFEAIDRAVGRDGLRVVLLLRLSPVLPYSLLNYGLGITRVRLRDYVVASSVGMVPGTFLFVYLGSVVRDTASLVGGERPSAGVLGQVLVLAGLVATAAAVALVARATRAALAQALESPPEG